MSYNKKSDSYELYTHLSFS